jgi:hypothetical protein
MKFGLFFISSGLNACPTCPVKRKACLSGMKCLPREISVALISLGRSLFHRGGACLSGVEFFVEEEPALLNFEEQRSVFNRGTSDT